MVGEERKERKKKTVDKFRFSHGHGHMTVSTLRHLGTIYSAPLVDDGGNLPGWLPNNPENKIKCRCMYEQL